MSITKRILVRAYSSTFIVTLPIKAKVTMGPDLPYIPRNKNAFPQTMESLPRTYAFRAYDGAKLLMYLPRAEWMRELDSTSMERIEITDPWAVPRDQEGIKSVVDRATSTKRSKLAVLLSETELEVPEQGMV